MTSPDRSRMRDRPAFPSIVCGLVVAAVIALVGLGYVFTRPTLLTATAATVVLPSDSVAPGDAPGYYETLSRGQIPETYAQILRLPRFQQEAAEKLGLSPAEAKSATTSVTVVPNTAIIDVAVTAPTARVAAGLADGIVDGARRYVAELKQPYQLSIVNNAVGTAVEAGIPKIPFALVVLVAAAALGIATQQLVWHLGRALGAGADSGVPRLSALVRTRSPGRSGGEPAAIGSGRERVGLPSGDGAIEPAPRWDAELYHDGGMNPQGSGHAGAPGSLPGFGTVVGQQNPAAAWPATPWPTAGLAASTSPWAGGGNGTGAGSVTGAAGGDAATTSPANEHDDPVWPTDPGSMTRW